MNDKPEQSNRPLPPAPDGSTGQTAAMGAWASFFEFVKTIAFILIAAFLIRHFLIQPFVVDGSSMEPNFHNQEYILVDKVTYHLRQPQRGDVIVFHPPGETDNFIKRIIGLPGERVDINGHQVSINGKPLDEKYLPTFSPLAGDGEVNFSEVLQTNQYFVMGDNRDQSKDSREIGPIGKERIIGKAWLILYPLKNASVIKEPHYNLPVTSTAQALVELTSNFFLPGKPIGQTQT